MVPTIAVFSSHSFSSILVLKKDYMYGMSVNGYHDRKKKAWAA